MLKDERPAIFGDGEQVRDFICVEDVARANMLAMDAGAPHLVCNIGTGRGTSVNDIYRLLKDKLAFEGEAEYVPARAGEPGNSIAGTKRAEEKIGFRARCRLEDNIDDVIGWNRRLL
jgi:UDP-glucose 4-epimerase